MKRITTMRQLAAAALAAFVLATSAYASAPNAVIEESIALLTERLDGRKDELAAKRQRPVVERVVGHARRSSSAQGGGDVPRRLPAMDARREL